MAVQLRRRALVFPRKRCKVHIYVPVIYRFFIAQSGAAGRQPGVTSVLTRMGLARGQLKTSSLGNGQQSEIAQDWRTDRAGRQVLFLVPNVCWANWITLAGIGSANWCGNGSLRVCQLNPRTKCLHKFQNCLRCASI